MRRQTLIALAVAVVLGLIAVYLANAYIGRGDQRVADAQVGTTKVAVAAIPLDYGTDLTPDKVKFVDYPSASLPTGIFSNYNQLAPAGKRRVVLRPIALNEPILATKLAGEGLGPSIAYLLPDGMRAAAVRINDVSGVAGFVQPMDTVDVLITRQASAEGNRQVTDVLLQDVKVIAIDQDAKGADGKPVIAKTATLEVNPMDAQKLALAQQRRLAQPGAAQARRGAGSWPRRDGQPQRLALFLLRRRKRHACGRGDDRSGPATRNRRERTAPRHHPSPGACPAAVEERRSRAGNHGQQL